MTRPSLRRIGALAAVLALAPLAAAAQNLFAPVMQVNDKVITEYEVRQRAEFFSILNAPGDPRQSALDRLIEEKLQVGAAEALGITVTDEQVVAGEEEFAGRANLDRAAFLKALAQGGVDENTVRDLVTSGLMWREVVRQRFAGLVKVSDADIDQALSDTAPRSGAVRILASEIILPANTPEAKAESQRRAAEIARITSIDQFSQAARAFSASPSRDRGGRLDWLEVANMQPGLAQILLGLAPGQVSQPLPIPNAIALFQLRAIEDGVAPPPSPLTVDYAIWLIPGGRTPAALAEAARVEAAAATCNELYELNRRERGPDARLERVSSDMAQVPADVAIELAQLDPNEYSTALTRGGNLALLMLCSRQVPLAEGVTRDQVRDQLANRRIQSYAQGYLDELRANAIIKVP